MNIYAKMNWNNTVLYRTDVDLHTAQIFITPSRSDNYVLQKTSDVAAQYRLAVCVNGGGFDYIKTRGQPRGVVVSRGKIHCRARRIEQSIYFSDKNKVMFLFTRNAWNAINFSNRLIIGGVPCWHPLNTQIAPRTMLGLTSTTLSFLVVDGVEGKTGATLDQCAKLCSELGFLTAILLDSGGSSTFCIDGKLVNIPSDDNIPGHERPVPTHIGAYS